MLWVCAVQARMGRPYVSCQDAGFGLRRHASRGAGVKGRMLALTASPAPLRGCAWSSPFREAFAYFALFRGRAPARFVVQMLPHPALSQRERGEEVPHPARGDELSNKKGEACLIPHK